VELVRRLEMICSRFEEAWAAGRRPVLEEYLQQVPVAARQVLLADLLRIELEYRRQAGETLPVVDYQRRFAEDITLVDAVIHAQTPEMERTPRAANATPSPAEAMNSPVGGSADGSAALRYQRLRFHAQGNLGEVHVARDLELGRDVALKRIQGKYVGEPGFEAMQQRFVQEAQITGRLEHPGVVPVYGLVQDADDQPCYAMRFIEGETLHDAIQRFHAPDRIASDGDRLVFRELLGRFIAVCQTLAYAHSRGILHRDVKPKNIMLGRMALPATTYCLSIAYVLSDR
jgi:tRNA A-37 threonylcarbamoyl transferase component Bud32